MYSEARKINLIKELLQVKSEEMLLKLESILKQKPGKEKKRTAKDFTGIISKKDASLMTKAINEGCEQINPDDWK